MVEEIATVVAVEPEGVWLTTRPAGSCHSCHASTDCGSGIVAKTFTPRQQRFFVNTSLSLLPGEQVRVGISEQGLVLAAVMVYLMPLCLMLACMLIMQWLWQPSEGLLLFVAFIAASGGFFLARLYNNKVQAKHEQVQILLVLSALGVAAR